MAEPQGRRVPSGKLKDNPSTRVPHKIEHSERVRFLPPAEEKKLSSIILERHPERLAAFKLALHTGPRLSEQYEARWEELLPALVRLSTRDVGADARTVAELLRHRTLAMVPVHW